MQGDCLQGETDNKTLGVSGEDMAAQYLVRQGFEIIARNVSYKTGEIDIVAMRGGELHFIEVRTRSDPTFLPPLETITEEKRRRIHRTAEWYLSDPRNNFKDSKLPICYFSVIGIDFAHGTPRIECIFDAFV